MFYNIKACSAPGTAHNEDAYTTSPSFLVVIDGATGLNNMHLCDSATDAQWLAQRATELLSVLLANLDQEISEIMFQVAEKLKSELDLLGYKDTYNAYPSASVSIVRVRGGDLEGFVLGDCPILVGKREGIQLVHDDSVTKRDEDVLRRMVDDCKHRHISMSEARKLVQPILFKNRQEMNQENTYWIFEPTGTGINHSLNFRLALKDVEEIALLTDGFFSLYNSYSMFKSYRDFMDSLRDTPMNTLLKRLRNIENSDPNMVEFPRLKVSDDATSVYAAVSAG